MGNDLKEPTEKPQDDLPFVKYEAPPAFISKYLGSFAEVRDPKKKATPKPE